SRAEMRSISIPGCEWTCNISIIGHLYWIGKSYCVRSPAFLAGREHIKNALSTYARRSRRTSARDRRVTRRTFRISEWSSCHRVHADRARDAVLPDREDAQRWLEQTTARQFRNPRHDS